MRRQPDEELFMFVWMPDCSSSACVNVCDVIAGPQSTWPWPTHNISSVFLDIVSVLLVGLNGKGKRNVWLTLTAAWVTRYLIYWPPPPINISLESLWLKLQYLKICVCVSVSSYDCCPDIRGHCHICLNWAWLESVSQREALATPKTFQRRWFQHLFRGMQDTHTSASVTVPHMTGLERIKISTNPFWNGLNPNWGHRLKSLATFTAPQSCS